MDLYTLPSQTNQMKYIIVLLAFTALFSSCRLFGFRHIEGNGVITTQTRNINKANRIKLAGSFDVEIIQGNTTGVQIEGDENILPYIIITEKDGFLVIKSKDHFSYSSTDKIKIRITTPQLEQVNLVGSGDIIGKGKFIGADKLKLNIAGSGDIRMEVNTPTIESEIAGSGSITLSGETKDETITIAGVGDYNSDGLKAENAKVIIAGSGDVKVFAASHLNVSIAGSGNVSYKGNPTIKQHIAGSGDVKKID